MKLRPERCEGELLNAARHASYEIEMLIFCAEGLSGWHSSPISPPGGNMANVLLESLLLHFRNLRAFLCPSLQMLHEDDILASDFLGLREPKDIGDPVKFGKDKQRLDGMLSHLSYRRPDYITAGADGWDVAEMTIAVLEQVKGFLAQVSDDWKARFPAVRKIDEAIEREKRKAANRA